MKLAFVFPGQGSQKVGMLAGFEGNDVVADVMRRADAALGQDLTGLIANGPEADLNLTVNTQPAMLASSYAMYAAWLAVGGMKPVVMAGHSLGEYTALTAAGVFTLEQAVGLVRFRAQAMQSAVPVGVGAMAAILGLTDEVVADVCRAASEDGKYVVEPVNFNCPGQVVIAGHREGIEKACEIAQEKGARRALKLAVSAPFHSSLLVGAAKQLAERLAQIDVMAPAIDVIANVDVAVHHEPQDIRDILSRQAASPVQWVKTIQKMAADGVTHIVECGPGKVLTGMIRRIAPEIKIYNIYDAQTLASVKDALAAEG
ncbi:MAG: ACP S-malonyltransferase [Duodenibacillus sp.]|nr:ACP S-malonyltransferase [Duodenibacillus sp.]